MSKFWKIVLILLGFGFLALAALFALGYFKPKKAGIRITSVPAAVVFINGNQVGKTPYEATFGAGEVGLKLVPDAGDKPLANFETRVLLSSGIQTVISRNFAETEALSSGEIVSFERTPGIEAALAVVSDPDSVQIAIDGTPRGFAPYKTSTLTVGQHQIGVSAPGYVEQTLTVNTRAGYKLTVVVKLAVNSAVQPTPSAAPGVSPTPTPVAKLQVLILQTPNGFLRVRVGPSTNAEEIGRVEPGKKYLLVEKDSQTDWLKIEYLTGQTGWVSGEYAQIETPP